MNNIFLELTAILVLASSVAYVCHFLKQPSIVAYIIAGLLLGPVGLFHLNRGAEFQSLAQIGITLLLFTVGLELDFNVIRKLGKSVLVAGVAQILITFATAFGILRILGVTGTAAYLLGLAITFSSTIVIIKLLSEKKDLESLYGKITLGILLLQDIVAIVALIIVNGADSSHMPALVSLIGWQSFIFTIAKALSIGLAITFIGKKVWPKILKHIGKSDELLLATSLAWALGLAAFFSLPAIGFGVEIGGFVAGLALANSSIHYQISSRIKSIRDFFLIIFFIILGSQFSFAGIGNALIPALLITGFVLLIKPLITIAILGALGYKPRTAFSAGVSLGQISEFSLILVAIGISLGLLNEGYSGLITLIAILSLAISSYTIKYSSKLYNLLHVPLEFFDFRGGFAEKHIKNQNLKQHIVVLGGHRLGHHIVESLQKLERKFILVDFNPDVVEHFKRRDVTAICGDIIDPHIQDLCNIDFARVIISTIPDMKDNIQVLESVRERNPKAKIILTAQDESEALELYGKAAHYVILPHFIGGLHVADLLGADLKLSDLPRLKKEHMRILKKMA